MQISSTQISLKSESWSTQESFTSSEGSATNFSYANTHNSSLLKISRQRSYSVRNTGFHNLENKILLLVFSHFNLKEISVISRVCRHWNKVTRDPRFWKSLEFTGTHFSILSFKSEIFHNYLMSLEYKFIHKFRKKL